MKIRTRAMTLVAVIGLGLLIGGQITPARTITASYQAVVPLPEVYFLIPTTASISISALNGTALLIVSQLGGNLSNLPPTVNVSVVQKDIVTFSVPNRGYYSVEFLGSNGVPVAVTYDLSEGGQPSDVTYFGSGILVTGLVGVAALSVLGRRKGISEEERRRHALDPQFASFKIQVDNIRMLYNRLCRQ